MPGCLAALRVRLVWESPRYPLWITSMRGMYAFASFRAAVTPQAGMHAIGRHPRYASMPYIPAIPCAIWDTHAQRTALLAPCLARCLMHGERSHMVVVPLPGRWATRRAD